jgi:hypothetical protein
MVESLIAGDTTRDDDSDPDEDQAEALQKKLKAAGLVAQPGESELVR